MSFRRLQRAPLETMNSKPLATRHLDIRSARLRVENALHNASRNHEHLQGLCVKDCRSTVSWTMPALVPLNTVLACSVARGLPKGGAATYVPGGRLFVLEQPLVSGEVHALRSRAVPHCCRLLGFRWYPRLPGFRWYPGPPGAVPPVTGCSRAPGCATPVLPTAALDPSGIPTGYSGPSLLKHSERLQFLKVPCWSTTVHEPEHLSFMHGMFLVAFDVCVHCHCLPRHEAEEGIVIHPELVPK